MRKTRRWPRLSVAPLKQSADKKGEPMTIQEMGPGKIEVRLTVYSRFIIDEDDLKPLKDEGWDDALRHLHQKGIAINKKVDVITK